MAGFRGVPEVSSGFLWRVWLSWYFGLLALGLCSCGLVCLGAVSGVLGFCWLLGRVLVRVSLGSWACLVWALWARGGSLGCWVVAAVACVWALLLAWVALRLWGCGSEVHLLLVGFNSGVI